MYNIKVYHINCKVYLQKDIKLSKVLYEISNFIDLGFGEDVDMLKFHKSRGLKKYVHSGFVELEEGRYTEKEKYIRSQYVA